ncbi:MAG TPA: hypothetical protein VNO55_21110 [Polyangia bacterium]|nr:hypothetical protein [Polyangia bacterium]
MACFSLGWAMSLCIWIIIVVAVVTIIRAVVPWLLGLMGGVPAPVVTIINVVLWAIVAIAVVYIIFGLIGCLMGGGSVGLLPPLPHR